MSPREVVVAGIARTEVACAGPGRTLSLGIQAPSGIDCCREPAADAVVTKFAAPCALRRRGLVPVMALNVPSLVGFARQEEG